MLPALGWPPAAQAMPPSAKCQCPPREPRAASQGSAGGGHVSWCSQGRVCPWDQGRSLCVGGCTELSAPHSGRAWLLSKGRPSRCLSSQGSSRTLGTEKTLCTAHVWTQESLSLMSQPGNLSWALVCPHVAPSCRMRCYVNSDVWNGGQWSWTQKRGEGPGPPSHPCSSQPRPCLLQVND